MVRPKSAPDEIDTQIYEEWVAYPDKRERVPLTEHLKQSMLKGWFISGWRGVGPDMEPLPEPVARRFSSRDEDDDPAA